VSAGTAAPADFVKQYPGGDGHIQGVNLAEKGDGEKDIAVLPYQWPHPLPFAAHDETHVAFKADETQILVRPGIGAVNPESIFLHEFNGLNKIDDPGHRNVTGGASGGLEDGGRDPGSAVPGNDDPVYAEAVSRADEGAEVLGVFNPVKQKDEVAGKGGMTICNDFLETRIGKLPAETKYTLMRCCAGLAIKGLAFADFHFDSPDRCQFEDLCHIPAPLALGEDHFADVASFASECFQDGIDAVDDLHRKVTGEIGIQASGIRSPDARFRPRSGLTEQTG
jgi:hypothetical protein